MNKRQALYILPDIIKSAKSKTHNHNLIIVPELEEFNKSDLMELEYTALGYYLKDNPLDLYRNRLSQLCSARALSEKMKGDSVVIGGRVVEVKKIITKHNQEMAILKIEDYSGRIEAVIFPNVYNRLKHLVEKNLIVEMQGRIETLSYFIKNEEIHVNKVIVYKGQQMEEADKITSITLMIDKPIDTSTLAHILQNNQGDIKVNMFLHNKVLIKTSMQISHKGLRELESLIEAERHYEET